MVTTKKFGRVTAMLLALVMLLTLVPFQSFAADVPAAADLTLKDGVTVAISSDMEADQVKKALFDALVENPAGANYQDYEWEYYGEGNRQAFPTEWGNAAWVSVNGYESGGGYFNNYIYPALKDKANETWKVRLAGATQEVTITKVSSCTVTYNYDILKGSVLVNDQQVSGTVTGVAPTANIYFTVKPNTGYEVESVKVNGVEVEAKDGVYTTLPVASTAIDVTFKEIGTFYDVTINAEDGVTVTLNGNPVIGNVKVSADEKYTLVYTPDENTSVKSVKLGDADVTSDVAFDNYVGTQFVKFTGSTTLAVETVSKDAQLALTETRDVGIAINADGSLNFNGIRANLIEALVDKAQSIGIDFTAENVVFEQYAYYYSAGDVQGLTKQWVSLEGTEKGPVLGSYYHPISAGINHLRVHFAGNDQFRPTDYIELDVNFVDVEKSSIALKDERVVTLYETATGTIDYSDLEKKVFEASVDTEKSVPNGMTFEDVDVTVPENIKTSGDYQVTVKFRGTTSYYASEVTFSVHFNVVNLPTAVIKLNTNAVSADLYETEVGVYDIDALKKVVFDTAVDAENSTPVLSYEDVTISFDKDVTKGGKCTATIAYAGTSEIHGTSATVTVDVNVISMPTVKIETKSSDLVLNIATDGSYDYDGLKKAIFDECMRVTGVEGLAWNNFKFEYKLFNQLGTTDSWSGLYRDFEIRKPSFDVEETYKYLYKGGTFQIRVSIPDSSSYYGASAEFTINVTVEDPYYKDIALKANYQKDYVLNYGSDGKFDYDRLEKEIFDAVIDLENSPANVSFDTAIITYQIMDAMGTDTGIGAGEYYDFAQGTLPADAGNTYRYMYKGGTFNIKVAAPATEDCRAVEVVFSVNVQPFSRVSSNVILKSGAIDYTSDVKAIKEYIFNNLIDFNASKLPADVTIDDFTFEYYALYYTASADGMEIPGIDRYWVPLEGKDDVLGVYYKQIGNGTNQIRVTFNGTDDYLGSTSNEASFTMSKASFSISLKQNYKYLDEALPKDFVQPSVNDNFQHFYFILDASSAQATIYLDSFSGIKQTDISVLPSIMFQNVLGRSAIEVYTQGLSRDELIKLVNSEELVGYAEANYHIDAAAINAMKDIVNSIPTSVTNIKLKEGQPTTPGTYTVFAMATNENYNTAFTSSVFYVKYHSTGTKLVFVQDTDGLNSFNVGNFDYSAVVTKDGVPVQSDNVRYIYTGFRSNALFYASTKEGPRQAGIYTQTAWTLLGTYAFPKTRTFVVSLL